MYKAATETNENLCAHVCFLAHQAVEKTLKAGMFAAVGLSGFNLHKHALEPLACALSEEIPNGIAASLPGLTRYFEYNDCYLSPRYPNRCHDRVPSEHFSLEHAGNACEKSKKIFEIVSTLFQECH
jgi:sacsin